MGQSICDIIGNFRHKIAIELLSNTILVRRYNVLYRPHCHVIMYQYMVCHLIVYISFVCSLESRNKITDRFCKSLSRCVYY